MDVWDAIRSKRAIRQFVDEPLAESDIERILDAGRRSQSSKNSQPWHFIAIQDRETLRSLSKLGNFLGHVAGAAMCVAILTPPPDDNERYPWNMFDAGQCAAYMQLAAQEIGVGSCLGTVYQPEEARALLEFPDDLHLRIVISFGYPAEKQERKGLGKAGRRAIGEIVHWDRWDK